MATLELKNLHAKVAEEGGEQILNGVNLEVEPGEIHALMGPNGSGKSTTAKIIAGHPAYEVTEGEVLLHFEGDEFEGIEIDAPKDRLAVLLRDSRVEIVYFECSHRDSFPRRGTRRLRPIMLSHLPPTRSRVGKLISRNGKLTVAAPARTARSADRDRAPPTVQRFGFRDPASLDR